MRMTIKAIKIGKKAATATTTPLSKDFKFMGCLNKSLRIFIIREIVETLVDLMRHAKSDTARGAAAQALLDRGYGKSVAVSMDIVDEGQAHLEALQELAERRQRINREKDPAEAM